LYRLGNKAWTLALDWEGKEDYNKASDNEWMVDGKPAGKLRSSGGLSFLQVFSAG